MYSQVLTLTLNLFKDRTDAYGRMDITQEIMSRLKFIGKIGCGEKINTKHMYIQPSGIATSISRSFFNQDNRWNAILFVQDTVAKSFELLQIYDKSEKEPDRIMFEHLCRDLRLAIHGLMNLKATYNTDTKFGCDMDTLLVNIQAKLTEYNIPEDTITKYNTAD